MYTRRTWLSPSFEDSHSAKERFLYITVHPQLPLCHWDADRFTLGSFFSLNSPMKLGTPFFYLFLSPPRDPVFLLRWARTILFVFWFLGRHPEGQRETERRRDRERKKEGPNFEGLTITHIFRTQGSSWYFFLSSVSTPSIDIIFFFHHSQVLQRGAERVFWSREKPRILFLMRKFQKKEFLMQLWFSNCHLLVYF